MKRIGIILAILSIIIAISVADLYGQPEVSWIKTLGGLEANVGYAGIESEAGGYFIIGSIWREESEQLNWIIYYLDSDGDSVWAREYDRGWSEVMLSMEACQNGDLVVSGVSMVEGGVFTTVAARFSPEGEELWNNLYDLPLPRESSGRNIFEMEDGTLTLVAEGTVESDRPHVMKCVFTLMQISANGEMLRHRYYEYDNNVFCRGGIRTNDDGVLVFGMQQYYEEEELIQSAVLLKLDSDLEPEWENEFGNNMHFEPFGATDNGDGTYSWVGRYFQPRRQLCDALLYRLDNNGELIWDAYYGDSWADQPRHLIVTEEGDCVFTGGTGEPDSLQSDIWLISVDPEGVTNWRTTLGGEYDDFGSFVTQTSDGGFLVVGETESFGNGDYFYPDVVVVKFEFPNSARAEPDIVNQELSLQVSGPNPFNATTLITYTKRIGDEMRFSLFDMQGRELYTQYLAKELKSGSIPISAGDLSTGIYWAVAETAGGRVSQKLVLIR